MRSLFCLLIASLMIATPVWGQQPDEGVDAAAAPATSESGEASPTTSRQPQARPSRSPATTAGSAASGEAAGRPALPPKPAPPVGELIARDLPNDEGTSLVVTWTPGETPDTVTAFRLDYSQPQLDPEGEERVFKSSVVWPVGQKQYMEAISQLAPNREVSLTVSAVVGDQVGDASSPVTAKPRGNWFHTGKLNVGIAVFAFIALLVYYINRSRSGAELFIRKIAGLEAVEDAVGRATEMGRAILYVPGLSSISDVATIASLNILGPVAKKAATYGTDIIVPNRDPIVFTVAREVVKTSYDHAGRPDLFNEDRVFFITDSQFGFAAAVDGIIVREKPATNFFLGMFWAESLVMAETGAATGAIQIAGTDAVNQIPFFIVSCDYTLIGEELYAASAYLGREPVLLGSLKAQDAMKVLLLAVIIVGVISSALGFTFAYDLLQAAR